MLLDEAEEPMDFSRGSERLQEYTDRRMEAGSGHPEEKLGDPFAASQKLGDPNASGLDLSVLDRLSQKVIRSVIVNCSKLQKNIICHCEFLQSQNFISNPTRINGKKLVLFLQHKTLHLSVFVTSPTF